MWTLLFLFGLSCLFPGLFLLIAILLRKLWPLLLILLAVFIVVVCSSGSESNETEKPKQPTKTNSNSNRIRMEGKIGVSKPKEDKGVTQDYATYYTIFSGKK